jgi:DNA-directed RNA polymerase I subunit RPA1
MARSEAYNIVNVCKQYLVPKDATPLQGLIQDHIIAGGSPFVRLRSCLIPFPLGVKMTMRGRFFDREQYNQLVFGALVENTGKIKTLPPAIIKPTPMWSGKQIISTVILNLVPEVTN